MLRMKNGFTLIELAIAAALLIIALVLFVGSFVQAQKSAMIANNRLTAIHQSRQVMENLLAQKYNDTNYMKVGAHTSGVHSNIRYTITLATPHAGVQVKNIYLTNRWVNPGTKMTSTVSLVSSISSELHQ